jgi:hypothetical protein
VQPPSITHRAPETESHRVQETSLNKWRAVNGPYSLSVEAIAAPRPYGASKISMGGSSTTVAQRINLASGRTASSVIRKGMVGDKNPAAKLNWENVREIRASTDTKAVLAARYRVSDSTIDFGLRG